MIKFKTEMENHLGLYKTYDLVHLNNHIYMVDIEGEVLYDEWCFEIHEDYERDDVPKFIDKRNPKMAWWLRRLNMDYLKEKSKEFRFCKKNGWYSY